MSAKQATPVGAGGPGRPALLPTERSVPAQVGDGAGDAALAQARGAGLASREQTVCRGGGGVESLGCLGSG